MTPSEQQTRARQGLARAFSVTALFSVVSSLLGLARDLLMAQLFGVGPNGDAFLVAWSVPEAAAPLLIDGSLPLVMLPAFSRALAAPPPPDPPTPHHARQRHKQHRSPRTDEHVHALVAATLPRLGLLLVLTTAVIALGAPVLVTLLAPGLANPRLAVDCLRLTSVTVVGFGLAGYFAAGLRAHQRYTAAAVLYTVYNIGILLVTVLAGGSLGICAMAAGVAVGSMLMLATTAPAFHRHCASLPPRRRRHTGTRLGSGATLGASALLPVAVFSLTRQSQVYVERFFGSRLPAGTICHLNYAEKIAQTPMAIAVMISTVSLPVVARAMAERDTVRAGRQVEKDLALASALTLAATAFLIACAPQIVRLLFQHGSFTTADTTACATVLRVYSLGLLGQTLVGTLARPYFAAQPARRLPTDPPVDTSTLGGWIPSTAMGVGLVVTIGASALASPVLGAAGLAAANATGVTVTAGVLLTVLPARGIPIRIARVSAQLGGLIVAALCATAAATGMAHVASNEPLAAVLLGGTAAAATFAAAAWLLGLGSSQGSWGFMSLPSGPGLRRGRVTPGS